MTRMCKNGCGAPCYPARLVCKRCVADESLDRKRRAQGQPMRQGRKQLDGNLIKAENDQRPYAEIKADIPWRIGMASVYLSMPISASAVQIADGAKRSLRVSA